MGFISLSPFPLFHHPFKGDGVNADSSFIAHMGVLHIVSLQTIPSSCPTNWQQRDKWGLFPRKVAEGTQREDIAARDSGLI